MTTTTVNNSAHELEFINDLSDNLTSSGSIPYIQNINPPNMPIAQIKKLATPYGLFIPLEQAEQAEFKPSAVWSETEVSFGDDGEVTVKGYISVDPRFVVIHSSGIEVQEKGDRGYRYAGLAYEGGKLTKWGELAKEDRVGYRQCVRNLILFVDENNVPLHRNPFQLSARGGFGASLGVELREFYGEVDRAFSKACRKAGKTVSGNALDAQGHALCVFSAHLEPYKGESGKAPFTTIASRYAAAVDDVGVKKEVCRRDRPVTLEGVAWTSCLIKKTSEAGQLILALWEQHKDFGSKSAGSVQEDFSAPGTISKFEPQQNGSYRFVFATDNGEFQCSAEGAIALKIQQQFDGVASWAIVGKKTASGWVTVEDADPLQMKEIPVLADQPDDAYDIF